MSTDVNLGLDGKVALVTGGSSGIGRAIAAAFLAEGARVAICGRDGSRLADAAAVLRAGSADGVLEVVADVGRPADVARLVEATVTRYGRLDVVVSNAGTHLRGTLEDVGVERVEQHLRTKVLGPWELARLAAPHLRRSGGGRFILVIGQAGKVPEADVIASALTNAAQHAFAKALADHLGRDGILVNAVCPSRIATPLTDTMPLVGEAFLGRSLDQQASGWGRQVPLGRWGTPADVANAVVFLASDRASFLCGTNVDVDGGHQRSIL
jgi:NAD(P)-dependent dehydrogenase (short-subunit alcohol dehydrogenase family)